MPGSAYHKIAKKVSDWLTVVPECNINTSSKEISDSLKDITLDEGEVLVSFDIVSLYTNVPVLEAIDVSTNLLYSGRFKKPPVDQETFKELLTICSQDVLMLTSDGYYRQIDGLAMGSPPAPLLANAWLSQYDDQIRGDAKIYNRYMDDILREIKKENIQSKLVEINGIKNELKFTLEEEKECSIPFLDMKITRSNCCLTSTWYNKPTNTGLMMNYYALSPMRYKRSNVIGLVHRIYRSCSTRENFLTSLQRARVLLIKNQYPKSFFEPLIQKTIRKIDHPEEKESEDEVDRVEKMKVYVEYRGKISEKFSNALRKCNAPCIIVFTTRKLRSCLLPLKPTIEKEMRSFVVYQICCPRCNASYVGQTMRHLLSRFKEHRYVSSPVGSHFIRCNKTLTIDDVPLLIHLCVP
eukprot:TCONS_00046106-protein